MSALYVAMKEAEGLLMETDFYREYEVLFDIKSPGGDLKGGWVDPYLGLFWVEDKEQGVYNISSIREQLIKEGIYNEVQIINQKLYRKVGL